MRAICQRKRQWARDCQARPVFRKAHPLPSWSKIGDTIISSTQRTILEPEQAKNQRTSGTRALYLCLSCRRVSLRYQYRAARRCRTRRDRARLHTWRQRARLYRICSATGPRPAQRPAPGNRYRCRPHRHLGADSGSVPRGHACARDSGVHVIPRARPAGCRGAPYFRAGVPR